MHKAYGWVSAIGLAFCAVAAPAATLADKGPLPAALAQCVSESTCTVASDSVFELGGIAAFPWMSGAEPGYLLAYPLLPPSQASLAVPLTGSVWLAVQASYSTLAARHGVTLFFDAVAPADTRLLPRYGSMGLAPAVLHFELSVAALQAGHAERSLVLDSAGGHDSGDLVALEPLLPCVADGCSAVQQLNLVGLRYSLVGDALLASFAPADQRALLYAEEIGYHYDADDWRQARAFHVQPIPLPPALALLSSGLLLLTLNPSSWFRDNRATARRS